MYTPRSDEVNDEGSTTPPRQGIVCHVVVMGSTPDPGTILPSQPLPLRDRQDADGVNPRGVPCTIRLEHKPLGHLEKRQVVPPRAQIRVPPPGHGIGDALVAEPRQLAQVPRLPTPALPHKRTGRVPGSLLAAVALTGRGRGRGRDRSGGRTTLYGIARRVCCKTRVVHPQRGNGRRHVCARGTEGRRLVVGERARDVEGRAQEEAQPLIQGVHRRLVVPDRTRNPGRVLPRQPLHTRHRQHGHRVNPRSMQLARALEDEPLSKVRERHVSPSRKMVRVPPRGHSVGDVQEARPRQPTQEPRRTTVRPFTRTKRADAGGVPAAVALTGRDRGRGRGRSGGRSGRCITRIRNNRHPRGRRTRRRRSSRGLGCHRAIFAASYAARRKIWRACRVAAVARGL